MSCGGLKTDQTTHNPLRTRSVSSSPPPPPPPPPPPTCLQVGRFRNQQKRKNMCVGELMLFHRTSSSLLSLFPPLCSPHSIHFCSSPLSTAKKVIHKHHLTLSLTHTHIYTHPALQHACFPRLAFHVDSVKEGLGQELSYVFIVAQDVKPKNDTPEGKKTPAEGKKTPAERNCRRSQGEHHATWAATRPPRHAGRQRRVRGWRPPHANTILRPGVP